MDGCATNTTPVNDAPAPHLTLTKTANGSFVRGSTGSYTLTASNSGTAATSGTLTISDTLPTGLSYSSASGTGWSCSASGQVVTCTNAAALAIGASSQVTITVAIAANAPSPAVNNAVVGSTNDPPPSCTTLVDGCATATTPVNDPPSSPHLTLTKTANGSFVRGSTGSYTLTASNSGTAATSGTLTISDTLPTGLSYSSASGTGWSCSASGQVVTCTNAAALGIGASTQVTITVAIAANAPSPAVNNAVVGSPNDPPPSCTTPVDGCATTTTPVSDPLLPHLTLTKTANGSFVRGSTGSYTLTASNSGTAATSGTLTISDTLPTGLSYSSASGTGWSCSASGQVVTCTNAAALGIGASTQVTITVAIASNAPSTVTNNAVVGSPNDPAPSCTTLVDGCATNTTPVSDPPTGPHLTLTKTANGSFVRGSTGSYTLTASNSGTAATSGTLTISDTLPTGLGYSSASGTGWSCSASGQVVTCTNAAALAIGASSQVTITVAIAVNAPSPETNNAVVGSTNDPPPSCTTLVDGCATTTTPVSDPLLPHLTLTKTANGSFVRGSTGSYTLTASNSGTAATSGTLTISDTLPTGLSYSSASGTGWSCSASGQVVTCTNAAALGIGASTQVTITVAIASNAPSTVTNNAVVGSPNDPAPSCTTLVDGCATNTTPVNDAPAPHLTLTKTANGSFVRGSTGSYTLTASNSGTAATSGTLTISDTLPTGLSYSSASGTGWSCSASGQVVTCTNAAALGIGASSQVTITVAIAVNAPSPETNNAVVGSTNDPPPSCTTLVDGCATTTTPVSDPLLPHLTLTKTANGSFVRGSTGSYTLTASNSGTAATSGTLTISDTLPTGLSYSSASGTGWSCSASGQVVTCTNAAALGIGASTQVTITVAIASNAPSTVTNNAVVGSPNDPAPSCTTLVDGCATNTTPVNDAPAPHLTLTKTANGSFVRGSTGSYTLTASNSGTAATSGTLTISDTLPTGLSYSSASGTGWSCSASGQVVTCTNAAALAIGASSQVTITVAIAANAPSPAVNNAVVGSPNDPAPSCTTQVDGCATATTPVNDPPTSPHLTLTKTANGSFVRGSTGSYTLTASNSGTAATSGTLTISDTLPFGLAYSAGVGNGWSCGASGRVVTCTNPGPLAVGVSTQVTITVAIAANAAGAVINDAVVGSPNDPPPSCARLVDGCATTTTPVSSPVSAGPGPILITTPVNNPFALLLLALILPWLARVYLNKKMRSQGS